MTLWGKESGSALLAVVMVTAALLPLGAYAALQARMDLLLQQQISGAAQGFYAAESGLEHALAELALNPWFDRALSGPDGVSGTADDGRFAFRHAPPEHFPRSPMRYEVSVELRGSDSAEVVSRGWASAETQQAVAGTLIRSPDPFLAGAVYSEASALNLALGPSFALDGGSRHGADSRAGLALEHPSVAEDVLQGLDGAGSRVSGLGGEPSVIVSAFPSVSELATMLADHASARRVDNEISGALGYGLWISSGSLLVADTDGAGVLVVRGDLRVEGEFSFSGLAIVLGDVLAAPGSRFELRGGLLQSGDLSRIELLGAGSIRYDAEIVRRVDSSFGSPLPRKAVVSGWREIL